MGFFFTLLYISLALLSPADLFPSLTPYRIELLVVAAALLCSLPTLLDHQRFFEIPQVYFLAGLFLAVFLSQAVANHWIGGGVNALEAFLPGTIVFYLIVLNSRKLVHLKILTLAMVSVAAFIVMRGAQAYLAKDVESPFLLLQGEPGDQIMRMRGLGFLHDPNDFSQFLIMIIPLTWTVWRRGDVALNFLLVVLPTGFFVWGIYLTHSRGAIVALVVILMLALRNRAGNVPALVGGAVLFAALLVLNFSGGREISVQAGSDRLALWGDGLQMFKQSPLFGVGYQSFAEQGGDGHTAHNSFVVCLAELGLFGYAFWMSLVVFTFCGLNSFLASLKKQKESDSDDCGPAVAEFPAGGPGGERDIERWASALRVSLCGFLAAAWFLSRAYVLTIYLLLGMAVALLCFTAKEPEPVSRESTARLAVVTAKFGFAAIVLVYLWIRIGSAFNKLT